jgi:hypothetical protein
VDKSKFMFLLIECRIKLYGVVYIYIYIYIYTYVYCSMLSESRNSGVRSEVDFLDNSVHC